MINKISDLIYNALDNPYCNNCRNYDNEDICDYCHRKSISWQISKEEADSLAEAIIEIMHESERGE